MAVIARSQFWTNLLKFVHFGLCSTINILSYPLKVWFDLIHDLIHDLIRDLICDPVRHPVRHPVQVLSTPVIPCMITIDSLPNVLFSVIFPTTFH